MSRFIDEALDKGAPIGAIAEYFRLSRGEVTEYARRRRIEKWKEAEIAKWRGEQVIPDGTIRGYINSEGAQVDSEAHRRVLCQRMKEEAIEANWLELQAARRAPSRETLQPIARKLKLTHVGNITINGKNYTRLLDQAMVIVRARIEIVATIGK